MVNGATHLKLILVLFHGSIVGGDVVPVDGNANQDISFFKLSEPCEKWIRKRTSVKLNKLKVIFIF